MVLLFLDDAYITHISKDKWKLNTIIKNHPIEYVTFLFSFEIQYILVNFIFEERMFYLLPGIAKLSVIGKNQRKKNGEEKFDYCEKTVEINKLLISVLKPLGF